MKSNKQYLWWQKGIVYQIYPRSFMDSNGDGVGDLPGVLSKLDYLQWLGVQAVWLSPIFPSPMADFGYDISDYTDIHPLFGTMADFDQLLAEIHKRNLKLILDLVPNHTSNEHPWFRESRSSRDNPKRNWYLWHDPAPDGGLPNNWLSVFGGSGWEWDEVTGQYYYHAFLKEQPDLNWRNPEVQQAMLDVMRFWLDKGVDGFRVDVMWHMIKDDQFRNNPPNPDYTPDQSTYRKVIPAYSTDQPEVHDIVALMRKVMDEYEERVMIGEIYLPIDQLVTYYGNDHSGAHLPFNFQLVVLPWEAKEIFSTINQYEGALPDEGWPNWVLGNHDKSRIASRVGMAQARVAALLLLTLRGTPTMYYGDELGMEDVLIAPDQVQDPQEINMPGLGLGRDPERTPMQWDDTENAGFTKGTPWLPLADNYQTANIKKAQDDPASLLSFYRQLIQLRQSEPALQVGDYEPLDIKGDAFAYLRRWEEKSFLIVLNLGNTPVTFESGNIEIKGDIILGTHPDRLEEFVDKSVRLHANEGLIIAQE